MCVWHCNGGERTALSWQEPGSTMPAAHDSGFVVLLLFGACIAQHTELAWLLGLRIDGSNSITTWVGGWVTLDGSQLFLRVLHTMFCRLFDPGGHEEMGLRVFDPV